jgi:signal transduction histidine kinase
MLRKFVLEHRQEIVRRCVGKMRQRHPALEEAEMIPTADELLDQMTAALELAAESQVPVDAQISSVFHEVRNALGTAMLAFRMIRSGRAPVDGRTADIVARSHARIHELVSRTLAEVRLGTQHVRRERVRLAALLSDIGTSAFPDRDIQITVEAEIGLEVDADVRLLSSAIENLVQNAVKFSRSGQGVTLRSWPAGDGAIIEVEDRCGGLPPGRPDDLFDPFVQKTSNRTGVGLGLTIVQRAVEAHGGRVSVRNLPGVGCVFRIELPGAVVAA